MQEQLKKEIPAFSIEDDPELAAYLAAIPEQDPWALTPAQCREIQKARDNNVD